jgi:aspartyl-tRNA(Asn)/glutamyl-tRNA(Gln) amidotransferase subunit A
LFCRAGSWPLAPSLDTLGILARDAAMLLRVGQALVPERPKASLRLAIAHDLVWPNAQDRAVIVAATRTLQPHFMSLQPIIDLCDDVVLTLLQKEAYDANQALLDEGVLDPVLTRRLSHGASIPPETYKAACAGLAVLRAQTAETLFDTADVIALPTMPQPTPRVAQCEPGSPEFSARTLYDLSRYTRFVNALGLPAVTIPLPARDSAMPSSVQLIARHGSGLDVLHAAQKLETLIQEIAR